MTTDQIFELRDLRSVVDAIDYIANRAEHMASVERFEAIRGVLADYRDHEAVPRCKHVSDVSDSPWGPTQCALPLGHDERHAYSPSEALS